MTLNESNRWNLFKRRHLELAVVLVFLPFCSFAVSQAPEQNNFQITWTTLGKDHRDSMPIGNGDITVNAWTESTGDLVLLIGKNDSFTENDQLAKIGQVRIHLTPNPFVNSSSFEQTLDVKKGLITIGSRAAGTLRLWVDANHPVIHAEFRDVNPVKIKATVELWRTEPRQLDRTSAEARGAFREISQDPYPTPTITVDPDTVLPARTGSISWFHRNAHSIYPETFENQHLESLLATYPDPLLHRTFGALIRGPGLVSVNDRTLESPRAVKSGRVDIYVLTRQTSTVNQWRADLNSLVARVDAIPIDKARIEHERWWRNFWSRSWIEVSGSQDAVAVTQGYILQRWMVAIGGRGNLPIKFNGSTLTIGDIDSNGDFSAAPYDPSVGRIDPDFRVWGGEYWTQNDRLIYWPMMASGDFDLLMPFFIMYRNSLPLGRDETRLYFHHKGASYPETMYFWGTPSNKDFGWKNPGVIMTNVHIRYHINGGLELTAMMLDAYEYTDDKTFARNTLLPVATEVTTYFDQHWKRVDGKLLFDPSQSLEGDRPASNPAPDIAGLKSVLPRLIALPHELTSPAQRAAWTKTLGDLPALPKGHTDRNGIHPAQPDEAERDGKEILWTADEWGNAIKHGKTEISSAPHGAGGASKKNNRPPSGENPELYSVFPYRLFGVELPDLELARNTFNARRFKASTCWAQDGIDAADLGLADEAESMAIANFRDYGVERFKWFWAKGHDWEPDLDNGGVGQITLQSMIMQIRGNKILLLPAWPKEWNVDFKLHAPHNTVIEGRYENGKLQSLRVSPAFRLHDIQELDPQ